jgi:hypothetical protein
MVPQPLGNGTERGYYVFFDIQSWVRERVRKPYPESKSQIDILHSESSP